MVLSGPSWKKGVPPSPPRIQELSFAALRGQKVFFVVLSGPSWKKGVPPSPPRIKSCPSRPFADKRFSSWSLVALRGKKVFLPALRGSKSCPSRPFADKKGVSRNPSRIDQALISQFPTQPNVNQPYPLPLPFPYPLPLPVPTNPFPTQCLYSILTYRRKSGPSKTAAPSVSPQTQN